MTRRQNRVDVGSALPAGATAGDGDGQYYRGSDAANPNDYYVCKVVTPTPPTTPTGGNSNAHTSSSTVTQTSRAASNSASQSSATGGKSTSTSNCPVAATGGNATGGNSSSGVSNSGNSTAPITIRHAGGQGGTAGMHTCDGRQSKANPIQSLANSGNSTATAAGNGVGNGNNSNNYSNTTNIPAAAASPYAPPVFSSATCFKGFSGGATAVAGGISFGGGKIDQNCAALEAARQAPNLLSFCKQYIQVKYVKNAGVTLEDCMQPESRCARGGTAATRRCCTRSQPIVVNVQPVVVPAPVVNVIAPAPAPSIVVHATPAKPRVPRSNLKCVPRECPKAKPTVWNE